MGIKKSLKKINSLLPLGLQREIHWQRNKLKRKSLILEWKYKGMPVPPPHQYKQIVLEEIGQKYNLTTLIETGTFLGVMIECQRKYFKKLVSVELDQKLFEDAKNYFKHYKHIKIFQGDSSDIMPIMLDEIINGSVLFWLDGHYSGGATALGKKQCPIYEELDWIFKRKYSNLYILIDDARLFIGKDDYPEIKDLKSYIENSNSNLTINVLNDIIHIH